MYILGKCRKCGEVITIDIDDLTIEKAEELLKKKPMDECPGMHVEFGTYTDYYTFDYDNVYNTIKEAQEAKRTKIWD